MYEELSRLMAGELEPEAADALFGRMAREPELSAAWERMLALPDLLASMPMDAPPPALKSRLYEMTAPPSALSTRLAALAAGVPSPYVDAAPDLLDPAPCTPDPREDTLDPDDVRRRTVRRAAQRSIERSKAPIPSGVRAPLFGALVGLALAAGAAFVLRTPPAPALLELPSGESVVEGDVVVHAGTLEIHVDGRARVSVLPAGGEGPLVVVTGEHANTAGAPAERVASAGRPIGSAMSDHTDESAGSTFDLRRFVGGPAVHVVVERGFATVGSGAAPLRLAAGESRAFGGPRAPAPESERLTADVPGRPLRTIEFEAPISNKEPRLDPSMERATVARVGREDTEHTGEQGAASSVAERLESVAYDGVHLVSISCDKLPCVAVYGYDGTASDWRAMVHDDVVSLLSEEMSVEQISSDGDEVEQTAIIVGAAAPEGSPDEDGELEAL